MPRAAVISTSAKPQLPDLTKLGLEIREFLGSDPVFYSYYLLRDDVYKGFAAGSLDSYVVFLLWFLSHGRETYRWPIVIPERLRDAVAAPDATGRTLLMNYASESALARPKADLDLLKKLAWYYFEAVPKLRLGSLVSSRELSCIDALKLNSTRGGASSLECLADIHARALQAAGRSAEADLLADRLAQFSASARSPDVLPSVSIVGFHRSVLGLGEDARCLFECLNAAGARVELVDVSLPFLEPFDRAEFWRAYEAPRPTAPVVIYCMPAMEMMRTLATRGFEPAGGKQHVIGYWPWETSIFPVCWRQVFDYVDEIWASSAFVERVYAEATGKAVFRVPLHVDATKGVAPSDLGLRFEAKFTFIGVFDFNSGLERKNPIGMIESFAKAFPAGTEPVQLVLKTLNGNSRIDALRHVQEAIEADDRIVLVDGVLSRSELSGLIGASQAYVSLHRSEGFGRPIAEAMLLGVPVIATGWSGNSDFLNARTGFPVRYRLRKVAEREYPWAAGEWAEPDLDHAAMLMRELYRQGGARPALIKAARSTISKSFSRAEISKTLRNRLRAIQKARQFI